MTNKYIHQFINEYYSKEKILKWNDEFVNLKLNEIDEILKQDISYENVKKITYNFHLSIEVFTNSRKHIIE